VRAALKRLTMAWTTGPAYGLSFGYDGFGNKLTQTVTKGGAPASSITVDANNRITGQTYDANGNMTSGASSTLTYDIDNRVVTAGGLSSKNYSYDPGNKRIWKKRALGGGSFAEDVYFYGIGTGRLGIYTKSGGTYTVKSVDVRFAGKLIYTNSAWVATDRLGSIRYRKPTGAGERLDFFPYGEERPSATAQDRDKFATYMRDDTGLDYADQRYFTNTSGRFVTPDPAGDGLNWYAYAGGDPVNSSDPSGLGSCQQSNNPQAVDPMGVCPTGYLYNVQAVGLVGTAQFASGGERLLDPSLAWADAMLDRENPDHVPGTYSFPHGECNRMFRQDMFGESFPTQEGQSGWVFPAGGSFVSRTLNRILENTYQNGYLQGEYLSVHESLGYSITAVQNVLDPNTIAQVSGGTQVVLELGTIAGVRGAGQPVFDVGAATPYVEGGLTLIHELGHIFNFVPYLGGSNIQGGDGLPTIASALNQIGNNRDIYNACAATYFGLAPVPR
jgi:RHS repeat-associated protein